MIDVATPQKAVSREMHAMPVPDDAQLAPKTLARVLPRVMALLPCARSASATSSLCGVSYYGAGDWSMACELWSSQLQYHVCR